MVKSFISSVQVKRAKRFLKERRKGFLDMYPVFEREQRKCIFQTTGLYMHVFQHSTEMAAMYVGLEIVFHFFSQVIAFTALFI